MSPRSGPEIDRLRFLVRVVRRQVHHLQQADQRLSQAGALSVVVLAGLDRDPTFAERVEAFVSRFSRLQDSLGDKLLPAPLAFAGEPPRTVMENLERAGPGWPAACKDV